MCSTSTPDGPDLHVAIRKHVTASVLPAAVSALDRQAATSATFKPRVGVIVLGHVDQGKEDEVAALDKLSTDRFGGSDGGADACPRFTEGVPLPPATRVSMQRSKAWRPEESPAARSLRRVRRRGCRR
jgi:hypothetical protein